MTSSEQPSSAQPSSEQRPVQDADPTREGADATAPQTAAGTRDDTEQVDEPSKKHGDPLLAEAEGRHGAADLPESGAGTATSAAG